jgi:hypothetical protein
LAARHFRCRSFAVIGGGFRFLNTFLLSAVSRNGLQFVTFTATPPKSAFLEVLHITFGWSSVTFGRKSVTLHR